MRGLPALRSISNGSLHILQTSLRLHGSSLPIVAPLVGPQGETIAGVPVWTQRCKNSGLAGVIGLRRAFAATDELASTIVLPR
jgi:hypothetical protein